MTQVKKTDLFCVVEEVKVLPLHNPSFHEKVMDLICLRQYCAEVGRALVSAAEEKQDGSKRLGRPRVKDTETVAEALQRTLKLAEARKRKKRLTVLTKVQFDESSYEWDRVSACVRILDRMKNERFAQLEEQRSRDLSGKVISIVPVGGGLLA